MVTLLHHTQVEAQDTPWFRAFPRELGTKGTPAFLDRFGPGTALRWTRSFNSDGYDFHNRISSAGRGFVQSMFINAGRETAVQWPEIEDWKDWAGNLFIGTIGNTAEIGTESVSSIPTASELSLWQRMKDDGIVSYGIRLFDGNPYGYVGARWGHWHNEPIVLSLVRLRYDPIRLRPKIDAQITMPLPCSSQLTMGVSFDPSRLTSHGHAPTASAHWVKSFGTGFLAGNLFIGCSGDSFGQGFDAGYTIPW